MWDDGRPAKITVDGTDFKTIEYRPFNTGRCSHKLNGPGFKYEIALACKTGYIVHYNGPFLCGDWPDLRIACNKLHHMLPRGEYYLCDGGYCCQHSPGITNKIFQKKNFKR